MIDAYEHNIYRCCVDDTLFFMKEIPLDGIPMMKLRGFKKINSISNRRSSAPVRRFQNVKNAMRHATDSQSIIGRRGALAVVLGRDQ